MSLLKQSRHTKLVLVLLAVAVVVTVLICSVDVVEADLLFSVDLVEVVLISQLNLLKHFDNLNVVVNTFCGSSLDMFLMYRACVWLFLFVQP